MIYYKQYLLNTGWFIDNEYIDLYIDLINNSSVDYIKYRTAKHHIIPKSFYRINNLAEDNSEDNLIRLLHKDHLLAHYYLCLCTEGKYKQNAVWAFFYMTHGGTKNYHENISQKELESIMNLEEYQKICEEYKVIISNKTKCTKRPKQIIEKQIMSRRNNGKPWHSDETKKKISESHKGKSPSVKVVWTAEAKENFKKRLNELGRGNSHSGKKYINNGDKCICIYPEEYVQYEKLGYVWGRLTSDIAHNNMKNKHKFANVKLLCIELDRIFDGPNDVKEYFGTYGHIYDIINGRRNRTLGYTWKVINNNEQCK